MFKVLPLLALTMALALSPDAFSQEAAKSQNFSWLQFNLYKGFDNKNPFDQQDDTYIEMEFGGRSGFLDFYGFFDVFDIFDSKDSDFHDSDNLFLKTFPRFSINHIVQKDLS
ncbi:nucleoside-specific channel-forming protein tsx precursor [Bdellovibrio bacteriovorus str. Tiberius]|uniref:Nucleoside-specific channel-forming protein tsx n=1 Tax=Bdellovibrio bacteriovorus str. Tiberius TaxID=1069642 RepID=K7YRV7_BDEBC|nr:nucleoside-specific channel-forming protein tsx precursor [Bdellovibrio bacteriovorus str. Tiberius]